MIGAIAALTALTLALLSIFIYSDKHESGPAGVELFRYSRSGLNICLGLVPFWVAASAIIYFLPGPRPEGSFLFALVLFAVVPTIMHVIAYRYLRSYTITVGQDDVGIRNIFSNRSISFSSIAIVELAQGAKGEHVLTLRAPDGGTLVRFHETIGGFKDLTRVIRDRSLRAGGSFKFRDKWGHWSNEAPASF